MRITIEIEEKSFGHVSSEPVLDVEQDGGPPADSLLVSVGVNSMPPGMTMSGPDESVSDGGSPLTWLLRTHERSERVVQSPPVLAAQVNGSRGGAVDTSDGGSAPVMEGDPD